MNRFRASLARAALAGCAGAVLAGCTPAPLPMGIVDPERIGSAETPQTAPQCAIRRVASVPVTLGPLPLVPATVNGRPAQFILDTGAESTIVTLAAAKRLRVTTEYDFQRSMRGLRDTMRTGDARLDSMSLGGARLDNPRVLVGPVAVAGGGMEPDGLLGASLLSDYDLDLDLPGGRLDLYERTSCDTLQPPWTGSFATLETTRSLSAHPFFPVRVNGRELTASLDTGAQRTVINAAAAQSAGIARGTGSEIAARGAAGETVPASLHELRDMRVGSVPVRTPVMVTAVNLPDGINALLGYDFLRTHRVWLSYGSRRLFVQ